MVKKCLQWRGATLTELFVAEIRELYVRATVTFLPVFEHSFTSNNDLYVQLCTRINNGTNTGPKTYLKKHAFEKSATKKDF